MARKVYRRATIAGIGTLLVAGCSGDGGSGGGSDGGGGGGFSNPTPVTLYNENDRTGEDQYRGYPIDLSGDAEIEVDAIVRSGPAVDFVFTTSNEFRQFEDGNRFEYNTRMSSLDTTSIRASMELPEDDYVFLVDNTDRIEAQPPSNFDEDPVEVELTISATPL